jgi:hypothetical protein
MEAIGTIYNGVKFRSKLEARWAVFFDIYGLKWEYEPGTFKLKSGILYCPDFYFPGLNYYAEIKPDIQLSDIENIKLNEFEFRIVLIKGYPGEGFWTLYEGGKPNNVYPFKYNNHFELCYSDKTDLDFYLGVDINNATKYAMNYDFFRFKK